MMVTVPPGSVFPLAERLMSKDWAFAVNAEIMLPANKTMQIINLTRTQVDLVSEFYMIVLTSGYG